MGGSTPGGGAPGGGGPEGGAGGSGGMPGGGGGAAGGGGPGVTTTLTVAAGGKQRLVLVHAPAGGQGPRALIVNLHGSASTAAQQEAFSGMDAASDVGGFVVAYPQADIPLGSGFAWNVPGQPLSGGQPVPPGAADDVAFLAQAITAIAQAHSIDPKRIYATGFSGGARMASQLGCDLSTTIAAVGAVSGLRFPSPCSSQRQVPVITFHGTADPIDPYNGNGQAYWTYSVPSAAQQWAAHDSCASMPTSSHPAPTVELTAYTTCSPGTAVELYTIEGEGHEWPGGPPQPASVTASLGPQSNAIDASAVMWAFFKAHPLP